MAAVKGPSASVVKQELSTPESKVLAVLSNHVNGLSNEDLMKQTEDMGKQERGEAVNSLLASGKIEILPGQKSGSFVLRIRKGTQIEGATQDEQMIYSLIEESGEKGLWIKDIREKTGMSQTVMRRTLKALEQQKLVKSIKAVGSAKKVYILYNVEADPSLTGGTFYSDQQLDAQFVDTLAHVCVAMLQSKRRVAEQNHKNDPEAAYEFAFVRSTEVANFIQSKGVCRVQLTLHDIECVLNVAQLDGNIERRADGMYRALTPNTIKSGLASVPCLHCPIANDCKPNNVISPRNCEYFSQWLKF